MVESYLATCVERGGKIQMYWKKGKMDYIPCTERLNMALLRKLNMLFKKKISRTKKNFYTSKLIQNLRKMFTFQN